jgi:hypothetical protein
MKKHFIISIGIAAFVLNAFSAEKDKTHNSNKINKTINKINETRSAIHDGFRVGLITANKSMKYEISNSKDSSSNSKVGSTAGFNIGYQKIKIKGWSWSSIFSMTSTVREKISYQNTMLEANTTFGLNKNLYTYIGLNLSKYSTDEKTVNDLMNDLGVGFGLQAAIGYQLLTNLSAELKYQSTIHTAKYEATYPSGQTEDITVDLTSSALYMGLTGTF